VNGLIVGTNKRRRSASSICRSELTDTSPVNLTVNVLFKGFRQTRHFLLNSRSKSLGVFLGKLKSLTSKLNLAILISKINASSHITLSASHRKLLRLKSSTNTVVSLNPQRESDIFTS